MANRQDPRSTADRTGGVNAGVGVPRAARDAGLRSYMLSVYNYMASGVLLTGIVALLFANSSLVPAGQSSDGRSVAAVLAALFAPLGLVMWLGYGINKMSTGTAQAVFWIYAALIGVQFSTLFLVYTGVIRFAQTFFATSVSFLAMSLFGYTTKRDLSGMGTFLLMGSSACSWRFSSTCSCVRRRWIWRSARSAF